MQPTDEFLACCGDAIDQLFVEHDRWLAGHDRWLAGRDRLLARRERLFPGRDRSLLGQNRWEAAGLATVMRRGKVVAWSAGAILLPWCLLLAMTLPTTTRAQNSALAWAGLDGAEAVAALVTGMLLAFGDVRAALTSVIGGTLLVVDAWMDVCSSAPGTERALAWAEAMFAELPLAACAIWLAFTLTRHIRWHVPG